VKRVYTAASLIDGQLIIDQLLEVGVPALLFHANATGALGELPVTYPEVWIKRDLDEEKAMQTIHRFEQQADFALDRPCPGCGENNPATFEVCWRCHSALPVLTD